MNGAHLPEKWSCRRLRFDVQVNPAKSELGLPEDTEVSFVPMEAVGEYGGLRLEVTKPISDVYNGYTYFRNGDLCIAKITPCFENGKGALAEGLTNGIGFGTTELHVVRPAATVDRRFLFYISIAHDFRNIGSAEMLGAGGQKRVPERFIKDWRAPLPPLEGQKRIAAFLDEKTARIDSLIAKKQALLQRLAEKRQSIITQAVTKGLNPFAPMKDSGVEWLGQIPAHWELLPLRRVATSVTTGRTPPSAAGDYFSDGVIPWFTPGDFGEDLILGESEKKLSEEAFDEGFAVRYPENSVLLVGIGATLGKVALAPTLCSSNQQINAITVSSKNDPYFFAIYLHAFRNEVRMLASGNTLPILNQDKTKSLIVTRPPLAEQRDISIFEKGFGSRLAPVAKQIETSVALLKEERAALITAAVTGQIEGLR
jgi:type I restriction enzyme, S subunit